MSIEYTDHYFEVHYLWAHDKFFNQYSIMPICITHMPFSPPSRLEIASFVKSILVSRGLSLSEIFCRAITTIKESEFQMRYPRFNKYCQDQCLHYVEVQ